MIDLDAYLKRIGHTGPREPTLAVLNALCAAQPAAIAFENIDPFLGRPPSLALDAIQAKLVGQRRGGYCYEQNALLRAALLMLGMRVTGLAARVVWMRPADAPPRPRSHMLLKVELPDAAPGAFIVDAGFGGHLFGAPLRLEPGLAQQAPAGRERITLDGDGYAVEAELAEAWSPLYRFTLEPHLPADYEPLNWYTATRPGALFRHNLMLERLTPACRASLLNDRLTLRHVGEAAQSRRLENAAELEAVLDTWFDLQPPVSADALFERVPKGLAGAFLPDGS